MIMLIILYYDVILKFLIKLNIKMLVKSGIFFKFLIEWY